MKEAPPLLQTSNVAKSYGPVVALKAVDLAVRRGEIHALLGANGAGKSTLVKILSGVHTADAGEIRINERPVYFHTPAEAMAAGIATVFQDPALIPDLTVDQNLRLSGLDEAVFQQWLAWFGLEKLDVSALIRELPLETLRIVDLARALARDPHVLLLDEITAALTADQAERVFALLAHWKELGRSAVLITHRLAEVMRVCDRATILRDGRNVALLETSNVDEHQLVEAMLGASIEPIAHEDRNDVRRHDGEAAFAVRELSSGESVRGVSFSVRPGEILGLVALEGQGQDRLFDLLAGDRRPTSGQILVGGQPRQFNSPYDAVRQGVVLVPGDRLLALLPNLSVRQNLSIPLFNRVRHWLRIPSDERPRVARAIDQLSIDTRAASEVRRLSGGNQQKVVLGRWLVAGFRTLLCFDPTRGIDIHTKREIYGLLRELAAGGAAILLYTSELAEVPLVCDRVLIMHDGRIVDEQEAALATESSMLTAAHGLEAAA
jgi:ribose transport system ATP-binding protein